MRLLGLTWDNVKGKIEKYLGYTLEQAGGLVERVRQALELAPSLEALEGWWPSTSRTWG